MIDVLMLPGTGHPRGGDGVTEAFMNALDPKRFRPRIVPYPATFGGLNMPYRQSVAIGRQALITAISECHNDVIIGGYSQGAGIAHEVTLLASDGLVDGPAVIASALIADPYRPAGAGIPGYTVASGYGIDAMHPSVGNKMHVSRIPTLWAAAEGDPITALPAGNPLRSIADLTEWWSISDPVAVARWGEDLIEKCRTGALQRWWSIENWRSWSGAMAYARGYLWDGRHTHDYIRNGHVQQLADALGSWALLWKI